MLAVSVFRRSFRSEKAIISSGATRWIVTDEDFQIHEPSLHYLDGLRARDSSVNTEKKYAGHIALDLSYTAASGTDWARPTIQSLAQYLHWLVEEPLALNSRQPASAPKYRGRGTANAHLSTVSKLLRWLALHRSDIVPPSFISLLVEPKYLVVLPDGFRADPDQGGDRNVLVKTIRFRVDVPGFEWLTYEQVGSMIHHAKHARDRFLLEILRETGIRIGEALGLRRADMHLLPDSTTLGCRVPGPHIHVVRRDTNTNGALAKSTRSRWIPVSLGTVRSYSDYQYERDEVTEAAGTDMVFANLFAAPLGEPMKYANAYELFKRLAKSANLNAHPHMVRHGTITRWIKDKMPRDTAQDFAGHVSEYSMNVYLHTTNEEKREHARRVHDLQAARRSGS
ncbi:tyrosine-type recombinase/integrase [Streptomyces goshikiensis]|uniref:tyrosine-type recombinase/integrase n=1 Tax=Streptomyces goshikiensis TaxID=1942 RepID=UPI0037B4C1A7